LWTFNFHKAGVYKEKKDPVIGLWTFNFHKSKKPVVIKDLWKLNVHKTVIA